MKTSGPWYLDKNLVIVAEPDKKIQVEDLVFKHASFWVQIYDLPLGCMHKNNLLELGRKLGEVEDIEQNANGDFFGVLQVAEKRPKNQSQ